MNAMTDTTGLPPAMISTASTSRQLRVALVEDEPLVREMVHVFLDAAGYDVVSAGTAEEILAAWPLRRADILLTDVMLPGLSGVELAMALRTHSPELKVIYMSGNISDPAARRGVVSPETRFLAKPFTRSMLLEVMHAVSAECRRQASTFEALV
jgi:DNA-binding response OmpR family regulator